MIGKRPLGIRPVRLHVERAVDRVEPRRTVHHRRLLPAVAKSGRGRGETDSAGHVVAAGMA